MNIKDPGTLSKKWVTRAQAASPDYAAGVAAASGQAAAAAAAGPNWQAAVNTQAALNRFVNHLTTAGDAAWKAGVAAKGASRYGPGVAAAQNKWQARTAPYLQVLASLTLPAKGLRGSAGNIARVQAVDTALATAKASMTT